MVCQLLVGSGGFIFPGNSIEDEFSMTSIFFFEKSNATPVSGLEFCSK